MKQAPSGAIAEYAEWIPDGLPGSALKDLYKGEVATTGGGRLKDRVQFAFGAEFVEVRVHARTREIRVPRLVGAFAGGHIANTRAARSQLMGGMIWGIGSALHESTEMDKTAARYINDNFTDYLVAVNADVDQLDVILIPEQDDRVNSAGIKGLGELGNVGTAADCQRRAPCHRATYSRPADSDRQTSRLTASPTPLLLFRPRMLLHAGADRFTSRLEGA